MTFWFAATSLLVVLLWLGWERSMSEAADAWDRTLGEPSSDDPDTYMAPLRPGARLKRERRRR